MTASSDNLRSVEPRQVAAWLRANGWGLVDKEAERNATYKKATPDQRDFFYIDLPLNPEFRDYTRRMSELLETLVVATGKSPPWLLAEVRASTFDIIRFRSTGPGVGHGRVPVDLGTRLFSHAKDLVLAAACAAHEPRPVYRTRKPTEATDFLRRVKLAAPEEGSFIVTIYAPVPPGIQTVISPDLEEEPFERRSTLMLASAALAAREAAESAALGGDAQAFFNSTVRGVSANACDALAGLVDGDEITALDLQIAWATSRLVSDTTPRRIHVQGDLSPILREGARLLRASGSTPDFELEGAVVQLKSDDAGQGGVRV